MYCTLFLQHCAAGFHPKSHINDEHTQNKIPTELMLSIGLALENFKI